jgi:hypothetical protein
MEIKQALISGAAGAGVLTLLHETARHVVPNAPRVDVIGMRAIARPMDAMGQDPPDRDTLYYLAMAGDLVSNALYYTLVGMAEPENVWRRGALLGAAAGLGAAFLPPPLGLGRQPGQRFPATHLMTIGWYLAGGLVAAATARRLASSR